jgi:hypothetical protein
MAKHSENDSDEVPADQVAAAMRTWDAIMSGTEDLETVVERAKRRGEPPEDGPESDR